MISLLICFTVLIVGFLVYGRVTERIFGPDDRPTPAVAINDGVDCVPMKTWKAFLVQLLNIAGTGPIFGALMGAVFGPVVFLWIVFGAILGGAVHDYMSGMISCRHGGASIAELSRVYLGRAAKWIMRLFSVVLLVLCGTVFVTSPAGLLARLTPGWMNGTFWAVIILAYYLLAGSCSPGAGIRSPSSPCGTSTRRGRRCGPICSSRWPAARSPASTPPSLP